MDLLKKYIKIILVIFTISFVNISYASTNPNVQVSDCGVSTGVVKLFDGEICEQDVSFRMIYKFFPTVIENFVFPIINPKYLPLVPQLEEQNLHIYQTQEIIFFEIFKSTNKISYFIIAVFVLWHFLILGLMRSANDGSFLGKSWNTSSILIKYGILVVLLFPVSNTGVLVIHVILLTILIIGIYFANYFWGVYLNYLQVGEDSIDISSSELSVVDQKSLQEIKFDNRIKKYDHNYFFAYSYAKELSLIDLCKQRTEKLLVLGALPFLTESNVGDLKACLVNNTDEASWIENTKDSIGTTAFIHYNNEKSSYDLSKNKSNFFTTSKIEFGNKDFKQCNSDENNSYSSSDYNCGSINISIPSLPEGNIKLGIEKSNFYEKYLEASKAAISSDDPSSEVISAWNEVSNNLDTLFDNDSILSAFKHNKGMIKKNISFYFHKMVMNDALVGSSNYRTFVSYNIDYDNVPNSAYGIAGNPAFETLNVLLPQENFNLLLSSYMKDAHKVSKSIERIGCLKNTDLYAGAKNAKKMIESYQSNSIESISDYTTSCLDVDTLELIGIDPKIYLEADEKGELLSEKIENEIENEAKSGVESLLSLTDKIRKKRSAIEKSFYISIVNAPSNDLANRLRKEGWAVSGGYMLKLLSEKEIDNKLRHALQNSTIAEASQVSVNMLPDLDLDEIIKTDSSLKINAWFDLSSSIKMVLDNSTIKPSRKDLKYVDVNQYLNDHIFKSMGSADLDSSGREDFIDLIFGMQLIENIKSVVGIQETGELSIDQISQCISPEEGSDLKCPINLTNPIVEITQLGHSLINISTKIIMAAIAVSLLEVAILTGVKYRANKENKGTAKGDAVKKHSSEDKKVKKVKNKKESKSKFKAIFNSSNGFKALEMFSTFFHYFLKIMLSFSVFLLTVGFTLAYVIPLIPFIAFTIAFISWIVISLEILIIAPIWLSFLFRIEDGNKPTTELYSAGFNFVMQMLFRPALVVIGITVGWSLFGIIFLIINITMSVFISEFTDTGFLISFVYGLLIIIAYALVIYVAIKQIFDLMIMLPNKIFTKIGVQPLDSSFEVNAKESLSNFTMAGIAGSGILAKGLAGGLEKNMDARKEFKKEQQHKTEDLKKDLLKQNEEKRKAKEKEKGNLDD